VDCTVVPGPDGVACDDEDDCTTDDACSGGLCEGVPLECATAEVCVDGACVSSHCQPCQEDPDCGDGARCLPFGEDSRCLVECDVDGLCPSDELYCADLTGEPLCWDSDPDAECAEPVGPAPDAEGTAEAGPEAGEPGPEPSPELAEAAEPGWGDLVIVPAAEPQLLVASRQVGCGDCGGGAPAGGAIPIAVALLVLLAGLRRRR